MSLRVLNAIVLTSFVLSAVSASAQLSRPNRPGRIVAEAPELRLPRAPEQWVAMAHRSLPSRRDSQIASEPAPRLVLAPVDRRSLPPQDEELSPTGRPFKRVRIGVVRPLDLRMNDSGGRWTQGVTRVWRLEIESPDAAAIQIHLDQVSLPAGVRLYVSGNNDPEPKMYEGRGPKSDGEIYAPPVDRSTVVLEVEDTRIATAAMKTADFFHIAGVTHLFQSPSEPRLYDFGSAQPCNLDASCYPDWSAQGESVARIEYTDPEYAYVCSAVLLNNLTNDGSPLLLTAHHCLTTAALASTVTVYWQYKTDSCNGAPSNVALVPYSRYDSFLTTNAAADVTLISITEPPPGATYAAWTTDAPPLGTSVVGIHHPSGDYRRIAFGTTVTDPVSPTAYHGVVWSSGITEHGSSGSPLFNPDKKVIGTLTSGASSCSIPGPDDYHRFSLAYPTFLDGKGQNYLVTGLPDDKYAPNQSRATAATVPAGDSTDHIVKPGIDDWFKVVVPSNQFMKLMMSYAGTLSTSGIKGEMFVDSGGTPVQSIDQGGVFTYYAAGASHTIYLHVWLTAGMRVPYNLSLSTFVPQPPTVGSHAPYSTTWEEIATDWWVQTNYTPTTFWLEWSTNPNLTSVQKEKIETIDPNAPPYALGTGNSYTWKSLPPLTTIYFRAGATNVGGTVYSQVYSGTTTALPVPSLTSPGNGVTLNPERATGYTVLYWNAAGNSNDLYLGTTPNPPLYKSGASPAYPFNLTPGKKYYWKVVANFTYGVTQSQTNTFTLLDTISPSSLSLDFGKTLVGAYALERTITFQNTTLYDFFTIDSVSVTGDFYLKYHTCNVQYLNTGETCSVTLGYHPKAIGTSSGSLSLSAYGDAGSPHVVALTGIGYIQHISPARPSRPHRGSQIASPAAVVSGSSKQLKQRTGVSR